MAQCSGINQWTSESSCCVLLTSRPTTGGEGCRFVLQPLHYLDVAEHGFGVVLEGWRQPSYPFQHLPVGQLRPATHPTRDMTQPAAQRVLPSGTRSTRPRSPPHRFLHPEGDRAFEDIALHRQLGVLPPQPDQLHPLVLGQHPIPGGPGLPIPGDPILPDDPNRALLEVSIELPPCLHHRRPLLRARDELTWFLDAVAIVFVLWRMRWSRWRGGSRCWLPI